MASANHGLESILERIRQARNFDFRNYKRGTLRRRIERRMQERRCRTPREYLSYLERHPKELDQLVSLMLIKVTSFFRDPESWEALVRPLRERLARKPGGDEIRIWSAGCATGEETYSVAMLAAECLSDERDQGRLKVFGTDVDEAAVSYARRGIYTQAQMEGLSKERMTKWFQPVPEGWAVRKEMRRLVVFGMNNLVSDAPISRLDALVCRNVFIYLEAGLQKRVLSRFHYALRPDGLLFLGKSELIPFASRIFETLDLSHRIFQRRGGRPAIAVDQEQIAARVEDQDVARAVEESSREIQEAVRLRAEALDSLPVSVVATTLDGTVALWNRAAQRLWRRSEEDIVGKKLASGMLPGIPGELLVEKSLSVREGQSDREGAEGQVPDGPNGSIPVQVDLTGLRDAGGRLVGLLYQVSEIGEVRRLRDDLRRAVEERQKAVEDLQTTNEELQSANEELETTNEELQSANEELQTTNEELQSTNEELETTNEELQSTNAELDATNRELAHRTEELNVLSFYQRTIIRSLSAAVIVLDPGGRITMWNLAAERLLGITEGEAMGQLLWTLRMPLVSRALGKRIRASLARKLAFRREDLAYERSGGRRGHAVISAIPLAEDDRVLGAVVIVEDTTQAMLMAEEQLRRDARQASPSGGRRKGGGPKASKAAEKGNGERKQKKEPA